MINTSWIDHVEGQMDEWQDLDDAQKRRRIREALRPPALNTINDLRRDNPAASSLDYLKALDVAFGDTETDDELFVKLHSHKPLVSILFDEMILFNNLHLRDKVDQPPSFLTLLSLVRKQEDEAKVKQENRGRPSQGQHKAQHLQHVVPSPQYFQSSIPESQYFQHSLPQSHHPQNAAQQQNAIPQMQSLQHDAPSPYHVPQAKGRQGRQNPNRGHEKGTLVYQVHSRRTVGKRLRMPAEGEPGVRQTVVPQVKFETGTDIPCGLVGETITPRCWVDGLEAHCLLDSGSQVTLICNTFFKRLSLLRSQLTFN